MQHKLLLLFISEKVIVVKIKLCIDLDHNLPPSTVAADILPCVVEKCNRGKGKKRKFLLDSIMNRRLIFCL